MIEATISNIQKTFGADLVFENISFDIKTNERIGLIGPNGCGKTTLLKILYGLEHSKTGTVAFRKGTKLGYLHQIPDFSDEVIVENILEEAFVDVYKLKHQIDTLTESFEQLTEIELEKALKQYTSLTHQFEMLDGYNTETLINKVTTGLKISTEMRKMTFNILSGGEKTRVMLAKILLEKPSILMLDEPTNHLDLESIEWLESYLKDYEGSVLIVSHDRYFLDNVCKKLVELSMYKAHIFHGNYSYYVIEKERRFLLELKVYLSQQRKIKRMEEQIKRYRIWGVMRDSDKMFKRAKELELRLSKIERLDKPKYGNDKMKISSSNQGRTGKRVLEATHLSKAFDDLVILEDASINLFYQDRLGILGKNGSGKTTLLRMLLEEYGKEESPIKWGSKIKLGYLAQEVRFDDENQSVLDYFMKEHEVSQNEARSALATALFIRDDVLKKIKVLSGGEKSKLKLCSLTYNQTNLLILDEPTNHLDIDSREVLEELLLEFTGTILFVSHDRYFIQKIATRITELEHKQLTMYEGDYDYFKFIKLQQQEAVIATTNKVKKKSIKRQKVETVSSEEIYKKLELIETQLLQLEKQMEEVGYDHHKLAELYDEKSQLEKQYEELINQLDE